VFAAERTQSVNSERNGKEMLRSLTSFLEEKS